MGLWGLCEYRRIVWACGIVLVCDDCMCEVRVGIMW